MTKRKKRKSCSRCRRTEKSKGETFWCYNKSYIFDVDKAREYVAASDRQPLELDRADVEASVKRCDINKRHIAHVDASIPGIVAHIYHRGEDGAIVHGHRLIDGHHRAARSLEQNQPFAIYVLTEQESIDILMRAPDGAKPVLSPEGEIVNETVEARQA